MAEKYVKDPTRTAGVKIQKNKREQIHCYFNVFKDKTYFNVRIFYENDDGDYVPSSKGISVAEEDAANLLTAIQKSILKREKQK